jgi:hypothetical protein
MVNLKKEVKDIKDQLWSQQEQIVENKWNTIQELNDI